MGNLLVKRLYIILLVLLLMISLSLPFPIYGITKKNIGSFVVEITTNQLDMGLLSIIITDSEPTTYTILVVCDGKYRGIFYPKGVGTVVIPVLENSDKYVITVYKRMISGPAQTLKFSGIDVSGTTDILTFLHPNEKIKFSFKSKLFTELCVGMKTLSDFEKTSLLYNYIVNNFTYSTDYLPTDKVERVKYSPNSILTYIRKKGVCQDFAVLLAALLRFNEIPAKLIIGQVDGITHAWNEVYLGGEWLTIDTTLGISCKESGYDMPMVCDPLEYITREVY